MRERLICFVSLHAYPVIAPEVGGLYGGTETRAVTLARGCAEVPGYQIRFLARHPELQQPTTRDGIEWIPWRDFWTEAHARVAASLEFRGKQQLPRIKHWRFGLLWELPLLAITRPFRIWRDHVRQPVPIFEKLEADCFFVFGVHSVAASAIFNAQRLGKPSLLFLGANSDLDERYTAQSRYITPYGERASNCHWALMNASGIVVQNEFQQELLRERFGRESLLVRNPLDLKQWQAARESAPARRFILWIGRAETFHKRADLALRVAHSIPEEQFVLVLNPRDSAVERELRASLPANVQLIERVPFTEMPALFAEAKVFLNTSSARYEGFPNTFLQALASGVPIASLEVADDFLRASRGGLCAGGDFERLLQQVRQLSRLDSTDTPKASTVDMPHAQAFLQTEHSLENAARQILHQADQLITDTPP